MYFTVIILITLFPFGNFLKQNINQLQFFDINFFYFVLFILIIFLIIFLLEISLKNKIKIFKNFSMLCASFWIVQCFYYDIKDIFLNFSNPKIITISTVIFLSTLIFLLLIQRKFQKFFLLVLITNYVFFISISYYNKIDKNLFENKKYTAEKKLISNKDNYSNIKKPDIFFILADGLTSFKNLKTYFNYNANNIINEFENLDFVISKNSFSSYNTTYLTMSSILSLDYVVNEKSTPYISRSEFYPHDIQTYEPTLIKELRKQNYDFIIFPNYINSCNLYFKVKCISAQNPFLINVIYNYAVASFLSKTLLSSIIEAYNVRDTILKVYNIKNSIHPRETFKLLNHNLNMDYKYWKFNNIFTFVHHMVPHDARTSDCKIVEKKFTDYIYKSSVDCAFKQLLDTTKNIISLFPEAIIIIQGDHGAGHNFNFDVDFNQLSKEEIISRLGIMNIARLPNNCKNNFKEGIGTVDTIKLVLSCISSKEYNFKNESESFIGFYENNRNFGKVFKADNLN